jgi:hypothetical protein
MCPWHSCDVPNIFYLFKCYFYTLQGIIKNCFCMFAFDQHVFVVSNFKMFCKIFVILFFFSLLKCIKFTASIPVAYSASLQFYYFMKCFSFQLIFSEKLKFLAVSPNCFSSPAISLNSICFTAICLTVTGIVSSYFAEQYRYLFIFQLFA